MYVIKHTPEDFHVKELISLPFCEGPYTYYWMCKRGIGTLPAVMRLARASRINPKHIGFAGNKDARAITEQAISVRGTLLRTKLPGVTCTFLGIGREPVALGHNTGNFFRIIVRNITDVPLLLQEFVNYFGQQRVSVSNTTVGKSIITKNFAAARDLIMSHHTFITQSDPVSFLRSLPPRLLRLYIHAYQSFLWNRLVWKVISAGSSETQREIPGFAAALDGPLAQILAEESITLRDFIIPQLPRMSAEGGVRDVYVRVNNLASVVEQDDVFLSKKKVTLTFELAKGCYATEVLRQTFSPDAPRWQGRAPPPEPADSPQ